MFSLLILESFATAIVFSYLAIFVARRTGLLDKPDHRKRHSGHIPLAGGAAIYCSLLASTLLYGNTAYADALAILGLVFLLGLADDWQGISASIRLLAHFLCGALMVLLAGVVIIDVGNLLGMGNIPLLMLALPLTALSFAGLANAYNMIDGIDGLASGLALVPLSLLSALAWQHQHPLLPILLALATSLAAFMLFNLGPNTRLLPKMFLGDSGSCLLGIALCMVLVLLSQGPEAIIKPVAALWLVALPLMDMLATMALRLRAGQHPMRADRRHLHHTLQDAGIPARRLTCLLLAHSLLLGAFGLWLSWQSEVMAMMLYLALFTLHCCGVLLLRRQLGSRCEPA